MNNSSKDKLNLLFSMMLFGTIGTLSRFINMPSGVICLGRAFFGVIIILAFFYIIAASIVLRERLSPKKIACVIVAFCGMILVSGVLQTGLHLSELKGVLFAVTGGFFYAMVVLINKYMKDISPMNTTIMQLALVTVIMLPYCGLTGQFSQASMTYAGLICLIVLGFLHTGIGYIIYFDAVNKLPAQTVGILSYIDPVEAVLLSAFFLKEPISVFTVIGAVMILGATAFSELTPDSSRQ